MKSAISSHVRISYWFYQFVTISYTTDFYIINAIYFWAETNLVKHAVRLCQYVQKHLNIYRTHCPVKHRWQQNTYYSSVLHHLYLYLIWKLQLTPLLDNVVKMTLKRYSYSFNIHYQIKCNRRYLKINFIRRSYLKQSS